MVKSGTYIILLMLIFTFSISAGVSRACCWDMEKSEHQTDIVKSENEHEPCHTSGENSNTEQDNQSKKSSDCCYDMVECQLQLIKTTKAFSILPGLFVLLRYSSIDNFNSNTVEPLKHPPKVLL